MKQIYWTFRNKLEDLKSGDEAVTAVEYGLIAAATAVAIIVALGTIKTQLGNIFTSIANAL
nr:Flp family type IVb pilin [Polynucleobacter sp. HIN8]